MTTIAAAAPAPPQAARVEQAVQNTIMLAIAASAAASAFTHVRDLSMSYGLPEWQGWTNAVVVELMAAAAGLELRRRLRARQSTVFSASVLTVAVLVSLACQVAEAHASPWGWTLNAIPAVGLLAVTKLVLGRAAVVPAPATVEDHTATPAPPPAPARAPGQPPAATAPPRSAVQAPDRSAPVPVRHPDLDPDHEARTGTAPADQTADLDPASSGRPAVRTYATPVRQPQVQAARTAPDPVREIARRMVRDLGPDQTLGRRELAAAIRGAGHKIGTTAAGDLLREVRAELEEDTCPSAT